jgi:hypothetical protein
VNELINTPPSSIALTDPARQLQLEKIKATLSPSLADEVSVLRLIIAEALDAKSYPVVVKAVREVGAMLDRLQLAALANSEVLARSALESCGAQVVQIARDVIFNLPIDEIAKAEAVEELGLRIFASIADATNTKEAVRAIAAGRGLHYGPNDDTLDRIFPD